MQSERRCPGKVVIKDVFSDLSTFSMRLYEVGAPIFNGDLLPMLTSKKFGREYTQGIERMRSFFLTTPDEFGKPLSTQNQPLGFKLYIPPASRGFAKTKPKFATAIRKLFSAPVSELPFVHTELNTRLAQHAKELWLQILKLDTSVEDFHKGMHFLFCYYPSTY